MKKELIKSIWEIIKAVAALIMLLDSGYHVIRGQKEDAIIALLVCVLLKIKS